MRGLMCQSPSDTGVVCMTVDHRSVMVPRRLDRAMLAHHHHHHQARRLMKNPDYIKLGRINTNNPPPTAANSIKSTSTTPKYNNNSSSLKRSTSNYKHENKNMELIQNIQQLPSSDQVFQVVVMRVSLHCQGCANKLKKHLSKMEGVTSFSIDLESKRVTVTGHVSPSDVLENISKVKRAEFWA